MAAFRYKTLLPLLGMFVITEWLDSTPKVLRAFGFAIYFTALTIYLEELMPFQHFFMGLTIAGIIRNGPVASLMGGVYSLQERAEQAKAQPEPSEGASGTDAREEPCVTASPARRE